MPYESYARSPRTSSHLLESRPITIRITSSRCLRRLKNDIPQTLKEPREVVIGILPKALILECSPSTSKSIHLSHHFDEIVCTYILSDVVIVRWLFGFNSLHFTLGVSSASWRVLVLFCLFCFRFLFLVVFFCSFLLINMDGSFLVSSNTQHLHLHPWRCRSHDLCLSWYGMSWCASVGFF